MTAPLAPALLAVAAALPAAAADVDRFTGVARDRDGAVLYVEEHEVRRDGERLLSARTVYADPTGRPIAELRTDFSLDPYAPSYVFEDRRTGAVEAVRRTADGLELRAGERSRTVAAPAGAGRRLVAGQGLDRLVRARLAEIAAGGRLELAYALPSRLDTYDMRIRALGDGSGATVRVRAEFSSWILRLLAPSLDVEYDRETRRLLRYRGVSNLAFDGEDEHPHVEIVYAYPPAAGAPEGRRASR